jgi:hypothetical protein
MTAFQASGRGGIVHVRVAGDRVVLGGQAVTTLEGRLSEALSETSQPQRSNRVTSPSWM